MSIKNKAKDRNSKGRIDRKYTSKSKWGNWKHTPSWWTNLFMTRPERRRNKKICHDILKGKDFNGIALPLGNNKPHEYYW